MPETPPPHQTRPLAAAATGHPFKIGLWIGLALLLVVVAANLVQAAGTVLTIVAAAGFFAIGFNPVVKWMMRRGMSRGLAVFLLFIGFVLLGCGFLALLIPVAVSQLGSVIDAVPGWIQQVLNDPRVEELTQNEDLIAKAEQLITPSNISLLLGGLLGGATTIAAGVFNFVTAFILMFFILAGFDRLRDGAYQLIPLSRRDRVAGIADQILDKVGGYLVGSLSIAFVAGTTALIYLWIVSVPYALLLALVVAVCDLIPQIGATLGATVVTLVAFGSRGLGIAVATIIFFVVYQQLENWLIYPRVMRQAVQISNLAAIVSVLIGFAMFGVMGVFISVPGYAAIQLIIRQVVHPRQDSL
ncbi:AI-2E family transporter [Hamadaea sp. NPDC050747]|uniref:AI-2E family transporter n=1 Tax=Hamadaea sp. NPDC050747 TaxID=3155789 RepID=UPI0033EF51B6